MNSSERRRRRVNRRWSAIVDRLRRMTGEAATLIADKGEHATAIDYRLSRRDSKFILMYYINNEDLKREVGLWADINDVSFVINNNRVSLRIENTLVFTE